MSSSYSFPYIFLAEVPRNGKKRGCVDGHRDKKGREEETIDYVFNALDIPIYYYLITIGIGVDVGLWRKDWVYGLLAAYLFFILTETVLIRKTGALRYELVPFWSWKRPDLRAQIYVNILLFVPVGFLLGLKTGWKSIPLAAGMSAAIELIQLATRRGLFEFDDIIHNTLGAVIGFGLWRLLKKQLHSET